MRTIAFVAALCGAAHAMPGRLELSVPQEGCPGRAQVELAVRQALAASHGGGEARVQVAVEDRGPRYRVSVLGRDREFTDAARRCDERARAAAVFVALTVDPPSIDAPASPPAAPPPAAASVVLRRAQASQVPQTIDRRRDLHLDVSALGSVSAGPHGDGSSVTGGGELRIALDWRWLGVAVGAGALAPAPVNLARGRAMVQRSPFDLSLRLRGRRGRIGGLIEAGLLLAVTSIAGDGFAIDQGATRLDVGGRAAAALEVWCTERLAVVAAVEADLTPQRELAVGAEVVGQTPLAWVGALLGIAVRIR